MASPIHVDLVKKGTKSINDWRENNPNLILDLSGAKLEHINISHANLAPVCLSKAKIKLSNLIKVDMKKCNLANINILSSILLGANLFEANLSNSKIYSSFCDSLNLSKANISKSDFSFSYFTHSNFNGANLSEIQCFESGFSAADFANSNLNGSNMSYCLFKFSNLSKTNLSHASFIGSSFLENDFSTTNLTDAEIGKTVFQSCNLSGCKGLGSVKHNGPSSIDFQTIKKSVVSLNNSLEPDFKNFLFSAGFPMELIQQLPTIFEEVKYYSAFVSYGEPNKKFAEKLRKDLEDKGVTCWLYSLDGTVGKRTWEEIIQKRREADKMIILCSADSLVRDGVLKEIEEQLDEDPEKIIPISLDDLWKHKGFMVKRGERDLKPFLMERNYSDFSTKYKYKNSMSKLFKGLKKSKK